MAKKDFLSTLDSLEFEQSPVPVDAFIQEDEEENQSLKLGFSILNMFMRLDANSQRLVLEQLQKICAEDLDRKKVFTIREIAQLTGKTEKTIRNYHQQGKIKGKKEGGKWIFSREEVEKLIT